MRSIRFFVMTIIKDYGMLRRNIRLNNPIGYYVQFWFSESVTLKINILNYFANQISANYTRKLQGWLSGASLFLLVLRLREKPKNMLIKLLLSNACCPICMTFAIKLPCIKAKESKF